MKPKAKRYPFRGKRKTVQEIAKIIGLKPRTLYRRISVGLPLEGSLRRGFKPRFIKFNGIYDHIDEWAKRTGLSRQVITYRLKAGWSLERTLLTRPGGGQKLSNLSGDRRGESRAPFASLGDGHGSP